MTLNQQTDIGLCNVALSYISAGEISSLNPVESEQAAACALHYPMVRRSLLSRHNWNFASPRRVLNVNEEAPKIKGFLYAHKLPSDLISGPDAVYGGGSSNPSHGFENANDHIYSNQPEIEVKYRADVAIALWPAYFIDLVGFALASRLAKPLTDSSDLADLMRREAFGDARLGGNGGLFQAAKMQDAKSQKQRSFFDNGDPLTSLR